MRKRVIAKFLGIVKVASKLFGRPILTLETIIYHCANYSFFLPRFGCGKSD